jgi:hypothetical protein
MKFAILLYLLSLTIHLHGAEQLSFDFTIMNLRNMQANVSLLPETIKEIAGNKKINIYENDLNQLDIKQTIENNASIAKHPDDQNEDNLTIISLEDRDTTNLSSQQENHMNDLQKLRIDQDDVDIIAKEFHSIEELRLKKLKTNSPETLKLAQEFGIDLDESNDSSTSTSKDDLNLTISYLKYMTEVFAYDFHLTQTPITGQLKFQCGPRDLEHFIIIKLKDDEINEGVIKYLREVDNKETVKKIERALDGENQYRYFKILKIELYKFIYKDGIIDLIISVEKEQDKPVPVVNVKITGIDVTAETMKKFGFELTECIPFVDEYNRKKFLIQTGLVKPEDFPEKPLKKIESVKSPCPGTTIKNTEGKKNQQVKTQKGKLYKSQSLKGQPKLIQKGDKNTKPMGLFKKKSIKNSNKSGILGIGNLNIVTDGQIETKNKSIQLETKKSSVMLRTKSSKNFAKKEDRSGPSDKEIPLSKDKSVKIDLPSSYSLSKSKVETRNTEGEFLRRASSKIISKPPTANYSGPKDDD